MVWPFRVHLSIVLIAPKNQAADSSTPDFLPIQVVIIGAGIAGLTTAIALRRAGHEVTVLEQEADISVVRTFLPSYCSSSPTVIDTICRGMQASTKYGDGV